MYACVCVYVVSMTDSVRSLKVMLSTEIAKVILYQYLSHCCAFVQLEGFYFKRTVNHLSGQHSYDNKCITKYKHILTFDEKV